MASRPHNPGVPFVGRVAECTASAQDGTALEREVVDLFDQMRAKLLRYVLGFGLSAADAEEVVQDVFLALYRHLARGKSRTRLHAWLFQVAHNLSLKRRVAISRMAAAPAAADAEPVQITDPAPSPEDQVAFRQRQERLRSVVRALSESDRECLYLRAEGLRYREIADVMGVSLGGVANSLARSLARLSSADERAT